MKVRILLLPFPFLFYSENKFSRLFLETTQIRWRKGQTDRQLKKEKKIGVFFSKGRQEKGEEGSKGKESQKEVLKERRVLVVDTKVFTTNFFV